MKAYQLDPENPEALIVLSQSYNIKKDFKNRLEFMKKALDINPNHAEANFEYGLSLTTNRDFEEAKKFVMKGLELNPYQQRYYPPILCCVGLLEYEDAINFCNKSIEVDPDFTGAYGWKASMLAHLGRMDEAKEILQPNLNLSIETSETNPRSAFDPILLIDALLYILYRHHEFNSNLEIKTESLPTWEHTGNEAGDQICQNNR